MLDSRKLEFEKGYKALDVLSMLGYLGCVAYFIFGIIVLTKVPLAGFLMIIGSGVAALGVYVFNRIGHAAFIARDLQIAQLNKTQG